MRKPLSNGRKWADYLPRYHVTDLISEQVSDFRSGHQKSPFWEWEKATFTAFPHFRKGSLQLIYPAAVTDKYQLSRLNSWKISPPLFCNVLDGYSFPIPILALLRNRKIHSLQIMHIIGIVSNTKTINIKVAVIQKISQLLL